MVPPKHKTYSKFWVFNYRFCINSALCDMIYRELLRFYCTICRDTLASEVMKLLNLKHHLYTKH